MLRGLLALALIPICGLAIRYWNLRDAPVLVEQTDSSQTFFTNGLAMGSTYLVKAVVPAALYPVDGLENEIVKLLREFNTQFSTYDPESEVSQFNRSDSTDWFEVSAEVAQLTQIALELSRESEGAYDITVGPLVDLWSFGPDKRPQRVPEDDQITQARQSIGFDKLEVRLDPPALRKAIPQLQVDYNSIAPGYAADLIALHLESRQLTNYLIDIGGEVKVQGEKRPGLLWTVAIEKPSDDGMTEIQKILKVKDISVATSGDYRNYFEENGVRYSHTINPQTGKPITHRLTSVSILAATCAQADGLATTLMVMGPDAGYQWAVDKDLAAYMIEKTQAGFQIRATPAFTRLAGD